MSFCLYRPDSPCAPCAARLWQKQRGCLAWVLALLLPCLLPCCATAPAQVRRVQAARAAADLGALLTQALAAPESAAGKDALGHFIQQWRLEQRPATSLLKVGAVTYRVRFGDGRARGTYALDYFDELDPAADFEVRKLKHHMRAGVGVPLLALRENCGRERLEAHYPPEVISRPVTAVLLADQVGGGRAARAGGVREVRIDLLCPLAHERVQVKGRPELLAADLTVPWAAALARTGKLNQLRVLDMVTRMPKREPRLYLMEPYDAQKEPLIMIHGLLSTPLAWAELSNELWADERVRSRYQIWHYLYNTSAPALYSARLLRQQLATLREQLDPEHDDPAMRRTTLLTHSMGGLVGKALAIAPGDAFWKAGFTVPPAQLKLTAADRATLNDAFEWQADKTIHRIIFICTPHRGSAFADNPVGRLGSWLTRPPSPFQEFYRRVSAANPGAFTPAYAALGQGKLDSVNALSPRQPTLRILAELPFAPGVQVHSIIGNRGDAGPLTASSDGIVPYSSSHLDGAASECVVPAGHGAFRHPAAVAEVQRILRLK